MRRSAVGRTSRRRGTSGRRSSRRLLRAASTTTAMSNAATSCWYDRLRSAVTKMSKRLTARASSSPLRLLAQLISGAVFTSWPTSSRFKRLGRHSSSRTRTGEERLLGLLQGRDGLLPGHGRKILEKLRQRFARFEVVQQRRERHTRADEHGGAAHDFRIAVNDRLALLHAVRLLVAATISSQFIAAPIRGT